MTEGLLERALLLMQQQRYTDAEKIVGQLITTVPDNDYFLFLMAEICLMQDNTVKAEEFINSAIGLNPEAGHYYFLKSRIYLMKDNYAEAENYIRHAVRIDPKDADFYALHAQIKLFRKQYDEALEIANEALALDASHVFALNVRSTALLKLNRKDESFDTIAEALYENPNNSYTHSNYGWGLLEKGEVKKALEHFTEALRNDPNSEHAQAGMVEALKARFFLYRWFLKYAFWMSNMAEKYQWIFILGFYFGSKALQKLAASSETMQPFLYPLVALMFLFAFSTWIMNPVGNLFLRLHPQGKHLLNKEEKISSSAIGVGLLISLISTIAFFATAEEGFVILAIFSFTMMIPLSRLFDKPKWLFMGYNAAMFVMGSIAVISEFTGHLQAMPSIIYVCGLIAFQFLANFFASRQ